MYLSETFSVPVMNLFAVSLWKLERKRSEKGFLEGLKAVGRQVHP
jgi:hypothetical protein